MEFDTTPTTVLVERVFFRKTKALFEAIDEDGQRFVITLPLEVGYDGPHRWFAETVQSRVVNTRQPFPLTSAYDEARDEWFTTAGNYGIHSRDLSFAEIEG